MDDQSHIGPALVHGFENFVERHDGGEELLALFAEPKLQREERALVIVPGTAIRREAIASLGERLARHQHRAAAVAHARAGQQGVLVATCA